MTTAELVVRDAGGRHHVVPADRPEDLGSLNGTFLDGRPVLLRAVLVDGAVIELAGPGEGPRLVSTIRQAPGPAPLPTPPPAAVAPPVSPVAPAVAPVGEPIVLFAQFLLAGLVFPVDKPGLQPVSWVTSSHWGLSAVASTSEFSARRGCERPASRSETARPGGDAPDCPWSWDHSPGVWVVDNLMLVVLTVTYLAIAWLVIVRRDPAAVLLRQQQMRAARAA
jgi:hypothetical protein